MNMPQVQLSDYAHLHGIVCAQSSNISEECPLDALRQFASEKESQINWKEITNGHDFIKRFAGYCKRESLGQFSEKKIRTILHDNFSVQDFLQTQLCSEIRNWENLNSKQILN